MPNFDWSALNAIASLVSMLAFIASALYVRNQVRALEKDRYLTITNQLFTIWQSREFMDAQLWLLHRLDSANWYEFVRDHRGDEGEAAFHRVGAFYERIGTLARLGMVNEEEILSSIGPYAIAVWQKIEPLVREARQIEHSTLFDDFERLIPDCYECYVPSLAPQEKVVPFELAQPEDRITVADLKRELERDRPPVLLDVRRESQTAAHPEVLPGAIHMLPDEVECRYTELPKQREVVVYCA